MLTGAPTSLRMKMPLPLVHLLPFELNRHVADAEQPHGVVDVLEHVLLALRLADDRVSAHRDDAGGDGPDVEVVDRFDAGDRLQLGANGTERDVRRAGLE